MSDTPKQFIVRFPDGMREKIAARAKAHNRSMNAEIVTILDAFLNDPSDIEMEALRQEAERVGMELEAAERVRNLLIERKENLDKILAQFTPSQAQDHPPAR